MKKYKKHTPPHLYLDRYTYFVTARTFDKRKYFNTYKKLFILTDRLEKVRTRYQVTLHAWVVLANHYHILLTLQDGNTLSQIIKCINGGSSYALNKIDNTSGRQIWWNYWDRCIRKEKDFYTRFNYIHHNPVKHGYVKTNGDYVFSSYNYYKDKLGDEFIQNAEYCYPVIDFTEARGHTGQSEDWQSRTFRVLDCWRLINSYNVFEAYRSMKDAQKREKNLKLFSKDYYGLKRRLTDSL